jgi:Flp pilus assembly protein TadG
VTRFLATLARDDRGASIIELALVAPFMATLLIGMVDISRGYSAKVQLTQAAQRAIEKAMQGEKNTDLYDTLQAEGASAAGVATSAVTVKYWLECNGVSQYTSAATMTADYDKVCTSGQTYARYVSIDITKSYSPMFSTKWAGANSDGSYTLHGTASIRVQ